MSMAKAAPPRALFQPPLAFFCNSKSVDIIPTIYSLKAPKKFPFFSTSALFTATVLDVFRPPWVSNRKTEPIIVSLTSSASKPIEWVTSEVVCRCAGAAVPFSVRDGTVVNHRGLPFSIASELDV